MPTTSDSVAEELRALLQVILRIIERKWPSDSVRAAKQAVREEDPYPLAHLARERATSRRLVQRIEKAVKLEERRWTLYKQEAEMRLVQRNPLNSDPTARDRDGRRVLRPLAARFSWEDLTESRPTRRGRPRALSDPSSLRWVQELVRLDRLGNQAASTTLSRRFGTVSKRQVNTVRAMRGSLDHAARSFLDAYRDVVSGRTDREAYAYRCVLEAARSAHALDPAVSDDPKTWDRPSVARQYLRAMLGDMVRDEAARKPRQGEAALFRGVHPDVVGFLLERAASPTAPQSKANFDP